ncbi:MAG: protein kinase [Sandaracinaceae bacterium]
MSEAPAIQRPVSIHEPRMPRRFGKYTLLRRFAVGGMAELYLALQRSVAGFEKLIVVKRVLPHLAQDRSFIEMLLSEARIAATLNHPNVAHIYDVGEVEGEFYIAMEHIHGEDLRAIIRQMKRHQVRAFPLEHALAIGVGCCAGLAYAHEKRDLDGEPMGIVHRDVSPHNVLVTFDGDVKLVDFGIAKAQGHHAPGEEQGQLKGKVPYMSPEQATGLELDHRSDVFSLGIILFELCTGRRLFRAATEVETLRRIAEGDYPRPRQLNRNLHLRLEGILLRALAADRDHRYQSARQMLADLEDFIRDEQLKVSSLRLGAWMRQLFAETLDAQKRMLQEGRQMAEVLAEQAATEAAEARDSITETGIDASRVRPRRSGPRWGLWGAAAVAVLGVGALGLVLGLAPAQRSVADAPPAARPATLAAAAAPARPEPRAMALLSVSSDPAGAHVIVDGHDTGQTTPATVTDLHPDAPHRVTLPLAGYTTAHREVEAEPGEVVELTVGLVEAPLGPGEAMLEVLTDPPDARANIEGTWHEGGSPYRVRLPARAVGIVVTQDGYRTATRRVPLRTGEVHRVTIDLARAVPSAEGGPRATDARTPGRLTFASTPWCEVRIDGRAVGTTPVVNHELPPGPHTVVCANPEAGSRTLTITVPAGETVRRRIELP